MTYHKVTIFQQEKVEDLHESLRNSNIDNVKSLLENDPRLARAKNSKGQTALHIAVLAENEELIKLITDAYPEVVNIGDNVSLLRKQSNY